MASAPENFGLKVPPRARVRTLSSPRFFSLGNHWNSEFSITGGYAQKTSWTTWWKARTTDLIDRRPARFRNLGAELAFIHSVCMPGLLAEYFLLGFIIILPRFLHDQIDSHLPNRNDVNYLIDNIWAFTSFPLAIGISLLTCARLAEKFGNQSCHVFGLMWLAAWSMITGFARSFWFLCFSRALSGLGAAAFLAPNSSCLDEIYSNGRRKSLVMILIRLSPLFGIFWGLLIAGSISVALPGYSSWYFWIGSLHSLCATITSLISIPSDLKDKLNRNRRLSFDFIGTLFLVSGLFLIFFSIIHGPFATNGWATIYIPALFIIGLALLGNFVHAQICEYATSDPLIPTFILKRRGIKSLLLLALISAGGQNGILYLWTAKLFQEVIQVSSTQIILWYAPYYIAGTVVTVMLPEMVSKNPAFNKLAIVISQSTALITVVLLAISKPDSSYWTFSFHSLLLAGFAFTAMSMTIPFSVTQPLPEEEKRLVQTLFNLAKYVGMTLLVGIGGNVQWAVLHDQVDRNQQSIKAVFWFSTACAGVSVLLALFAVQRISTRNFRTLACDENYNGEILDEGR